MKFTNFFFDYRGPDIIYGLILFFLLIIFVLQNAKYSKYKIIGFSAIIILFIIYPVIQIFTQYSVWKSSPVMIYTFPPYQPAVKIFGIETGFSAYFFQYSYQHFIKEPFFTFAAALILSLVVFIFYKFNKFSKEDILFSAIGGLVSGWPGFVIYVFLVPILTVLWIILRKTEAKLGLFAMVWARTDQAKSPSFASDSETIPNYQLPVTSYQLIWLIAALLTLAFGDIIISWTILGTLIV